MEINIFQKNLNPKEEELFVEYLKQKTGAIEELLTKFSPDAVLLKISIQKFDKHDAYQVEFCLVLPTKTLVAKEASHQITKAIDLTKDRLIMQLKKHMAILREERPHKELAKRKKKAAIEELEYIEQ